MSDLILQLAQEHQKKTKEELSVLLDQEIERFSKYMSELGDWRSAGPLNDLERALVKTYLITKLKGSY